MGEKLRGFTAFGVSMQIWVCGSTIGLKHLYYFVSIIIYGFLDIVF